MQRFGWEGLLYNLLDDFQESVPPRLWFEQWLRAVSESVFLVGADLIHRGRKVEVRFGLPKEKRSEFLRRPRTLSEGLP